MSQEQNLLERHDQARIDLLKFIYENYQPRFYKHKVGRKQELITPWRDLEERNEAEIRIAALWLVWFDLYTKCFLETGDHPHLPLGYIEKETPDGPRFVKASPEEEEAYETSLHTPQSQHPS